MAARHEQIADELRDGINRGQFPAGSRLPSESELAARYGVARGTVRQAVAALGAEGLIGSRQGARRVVIGSGARQSFEELRSFAQWARAEGRRPAGHVISTARRPATAEDVLRLQLPPGTEVLYVLRVRSLDGAPVLVERTVYADWIAEAVELIEPDCESVTQRLYDDVGLVFAYGEHVLDAVAAGTRDAGLLDIRRGSPLLRIQRVTTTRDGRPVEWSDDRYRPGTVAFSVRNASGTNPLTRRLGPG
ncbi:GntR family transcriptional regulator [Actinacidiphila oryziradicis]|uniref:GntR family transcriptional regulator n=1 Tax=Actinacidiphila oryziradicis TaxID=2571141 RepID=UPI0023F0ADAE|nr:GntR family transcriptional regulator [Actinacidiphila oryziradicis]MCW2875557.1 GntR family transcriptional regulator [Actinacidiphila oryziradicis]